MPLPYPNRLVMQGEQDGELVARIQQALAAIGYGPFAPGVFDAAMASVVRLFQATHADLAGHPLSVDGKVGNLTWGAIFGAGPVAAPAASSALMMQALGFATTQVGVMEEPPGSNRGKSVDAYLRAVGIDPLNSSADGRAWCMAFVYWVFQQAADSLGKANPLPRTAGCLDHWNTSAGVPGVQRITAADARANPALVKPGMVFILDFGGGHGHAGLVERLETGGVLSTVEGNSNASGSRDGVGVFRLERRTLSDDNLKGFVDYSAA